MLEFIPGHVTFVWSAINAPRELETLLTERPDRCDRRSGALEDAKELANALLNARVRVEPHLSLAFVDKTDRQPNLELATTCFVEDPPLQPGPKDVQLRFTHRPLQAQQQIVEVGGIVDAVLVEDQRVGESADLQEPMPIARVAR